ncbi:MULTISPECIES: hypothetical protein [unclassified Dysgonomonas]|jgi:hypothetical protein|uniref:hypothetical protein n=1 Tax=unclassified Dysgonomonas TaxID=2630389 RepID=UPI0025B9B755|nr:MULTISPECIES: hypothetical protein [unclassified Dysgonomonas]MDR2005460.1 hypothetical protein [Prevotella sp.]HMM02489.1 hypothetical protein [Dysgonomonas sp.]
MNNVFLRWMYILILCLASVGTYGQQQTYPVQVYTQLAPPYTAHIPAYYTGTQAKLKVMLINTDMQQPLVKVYLRMKILSSSFSAVTPPEVYTPQIELQAGMPLTLSLNDLEPYFKKENLRVSGGQSEFYRTQMLPDNFYRFHFEAYEVGTNRLVSNTKTGFAQAMIASGEPPVLNLPQKGSVIKENNIPSIMFSWTPKHMNSIAAAYGTEYDISLVEIYDKQVAPEAAFDYSRVLYTETTKSTSFIHTVAQPLLIPGMRYAWRVQAKAREGVDEISVFKNNGYSPVSWFDYTADCKTVQSCGAIYENGHVDISWQDVGAMEYTVEYRKKGTSRWYTGTINKPLLSQLYNLQAGKDYEYRIGSRCVAGDAFRYNDLQAFHIPDRQENGPNCGLMPDISLTNRTPARELQSGMPVLVGDFPVFITKVSGSGRFTGEGYVGIPYLQGAQIAVTFKDIVVNTDNRLVEGFFETKYDTKNNNLLFDADQYQTGGKGVGDIRSDEEQAAFKVDYTINPDIKALPLKADGTKDEVKEGTDYTISKGENGKYTFILTDSEGKEHKVEADTMPATIEDKEGNTYEVNEKGEVKPVSKVSEIKLDNATRDTQSKLAALSFKSTKNTKYALDEYRDVYDKVTEYKDQYKAEGTAITASAKFMLPGASDEIAVYIKENKDNKLIPEKVRFVTGKGREYPATYDNQTKGWTLTIVGGQANDGQELYAVQDIGDGKYETLGKLNIFTHEPLERKVTLVPVNGKNNNLDGQAVQNGLNEIYGKVGIHWTVNVLEKPFSYTPKNGSTFNVTGSGLLSMFTDDMKAINEAFKQSGEYQEDGLYLFVIGDKASESGTEGDMPLGSQFGYLFPNATIRTIAHEVGHGAFNLEHPFDRPVRNSFGKGDLKDNLMEYGTGTELVKLQWDQTRAPGHVIGLFQKDKSGMSAKSDGLYIKEKALYGLPGGRVIELEKITIHPFCSTTGYNDYLFAFTDEQGNKWVCDETESTGTGFYFKDYLNTKNNTSRSSTLRSVKDNDIVYRIIFDKDKSVLNVYKITFGVLDKSVFSTSDVFSFFERAAGYKNNIQSSTLVYSAPVKNPCAGTVSSEPDWKSMGSNLSGLNKRLISNWNVSITDRNGKKHELTTGGKGGVEYKYDQAAKKWKAEISGNWDDETKQVITDIINKKLDAFQVDENGNTKISQTTVTPFATEDGGEFRFGDGLRWYEWGSVLCDAGTSIYDHAALPETYWNQSDPKYKDYPLKAAPTFVGVADGAIEEITGTAQLVKLGLEITTDKEMAQAMWNSIKGINLSTIKEAAAGAIKDKWDKYANSPDYITYHEIGKDGVQVASMLYGGFATKGKKLTDAVEETGELVKKKADDVLEEAATNIIRHFDDAIEDGVSSNITKAIKDGILDKDIVEELGDEIKDIAASKSKKLSWEEVQALFKRGNDFNRKARDTYDYNEIVLENGKRLDSYIPGKEIISRKATTLSEIQPQTFENYLNELITKYKKGTKINSSKTLGILEGDYYLEIPSSNKMFFESSTEYQKILRDFNTKKSVEIRIKYLDE